MSRLIISGYQIELSPSKPIARTLQVNDISSLQSRQANFTPTISVPRTANNVKAFSLLGIVGTNSGVPYQRNECYYYTESGECMIYKGWAVITSTSKDFKVNLYDGNIDIYKSIENETLNALPLDEINHVKTLDNIIDSINGLTTYKYILADYNGKALFDTNKINIDYLVPSVPVSYLWDKIFDFYGYTYEGSVFDTFNFQNLYMTFPKGIGSTLPDVAVYESDDLNFITHSISTTVIENRKSTYLMQNSNTLNNLDSIFNDIHFKPAQSGLHRIEIGGEIRARGWRITSDDAILLPCECEIWLAKNSDAISNSDNVVLLQLLQSNIGSDNSGISTVLNINSIVNIDPLDSFCIVIRRSGNQFRNLSQVIEVQPITLTISKVESQTIDFSGAFLDFKTKDFFNEILTRFSLTPFKDKYSNNYKFLTLQERLQNSDVADWSDKFIEQTNESYIYGSYAQKNDFTYKYNDNESDYHNGSILVENVNLQDTRAVINSRIYAPERLLSNNLPKETNVYKLWDKEVKDDGTVTYKPLDKRFYFLRADNFIFSSSQTIGSETLTTETTIGQALFESYFKLPFNDIIQDYYNPISQILNNARLLEVNFYLTEKDISDIDFTKLYWVKQLNSYFILNKVVNFTTNGITKCELIKVDYINSGIEINEFPITISYVDPFIYFIGYDGTFPIQLQVSNNLGVTWLNSFIINSNEPFGANFFEDLIIRFVTLEGNVISNTIEVGI